jgi:hypothetical protein
MPSAPKSVRTQSPRKLAQLKNTQMQNQTITIILSFVILTLGLLIDFPIEFLHKPTHIFLEHLVYISALTLIFFNYRLGRRIKQPYNWISHTINSFFLLVIGYMFLWILLFDFTGYYPVWTDKRIYINQADTTQVIVGQENRISGSIISWRERKVTTIFPGIRWTMPAETKLLNGKWKVIFKGDEFDFPFDTIVNFKNGKFGTDNNR